MVKLLDIHIIIIFFNLDYVNDFHLSDKNFIPVSEKKISALIMTYAKKSEQIIVYGTIWTDGNTTRIHDIHRKGSNNDGAIGFYIKKPEPIIHWIFIKFQNQSI